MSPETQHARIECPPWLTEYLESRGFRATEPGVFSNGRASVRFDGSTLRAFPANVAAPWRSDIRDASPKALQSLLDVLLSAPTFQSEAQLEQTRLRQEAGAAALQALAATIREQPESVAGRQVRRLLWSLYNQHHVVNLWRIRSDLTSQQWTSAVGVLTAWMTGDLSEGALRQGLNESGELDRWDGVRLPSAAIPPLEQALDGVQSALSAAPPGEATVRLARLAEDLRQILDSRRQTSPQRW